MDNKKKRNREMNREIEKKRRQKRRIFSGVLVVLIVACVAALGYGVWDMINRRTVMTFNGERVATRDFRFLAYTSQGDPWSDLEQSLVLRERAELHGISLTSEQRDMLMGFAGQVRGDFAPGALNFISDEQIVDVRASWFLTEGLMDIYVSDFEHDEDEFLELVEEFYDMILAEVTDTSVKYIWSHDEDEIRAVAEAFAEYGDFDLAVATHFAGYDEEVGVVPSSFEDFVDDFFLWDYLEEFAELAEGEAFDVIEEHGMFILMLMYEKDAVDQERYDEIMEAEREWFANSSREQAFFELFVQDWIDDADIEWNERAVNRVMGW